MIEFETFHLKPVSRRLRLRLWMRRELSLLRVAGVSRVKRRAVRQLWADFDRHMDSSILFGEERTVD